MPADTETLDPRVRNLIERELTVARGAPDAAESHGTLGLVYEANGLWTEALASFDHARGLDPDEPLWALHHAIAARVLLPADEAAALFATVAERMPDSPAAHQRWGEALLAAGRAEAARAPFERTTELAPTYAEGFVGLGAVALEQGRHERALEHLEHAVALDPDYRHAHYLLGLAYRANGDTERARDELALGVDGRVRFLADRLTSQVVRYATSVEARVSRASELTARGDAERAITMLERSVKNAPENVSLLNTLAVAYLAAGRADDALERLEDALTLEPERALTQINLAAAYRAKGFASRALEHADHAVALAPAYAPAHVARARTLVAAGEAEAAHAAAVTARRYAPREPEVLWLVVETAVDAPAVERQALEELVEVAPDDVRAQLRLAALALDAGERARAADALAAVRRLAPEEPRLGDLERQLEEIE